LESYEAPLFWKSILCGKGMLHMNNKKLCEELIAYFRFILHGMHNLKDKIIPVLNAMKASGGVDVYIHIFLTSALVGGEWSAS
jgi:hypothetical protein